MSLTGVPNRKDAREDLKAKIQAALTDLQEILDYAPGKLSGKSPFAVVTSGPVQYELLTDVERQQFAFYVAFYVRSDGATGSGYTAEDAQDMLDNLAQDLADCLMANYHNPKWSEDSTMFSQVQDTMHYDVEVHPIEFEWWD